MDFSVFLIVTVLFISAVDVMGNCLISVIQPHKHIWQDSGEQVTLPCNITVDCSSALFRSTNKVLWFVFDESTHHQLNVPSTKYSLDKGDLTIHSLQTNDSGVYYCAAVLHSITEGAQKIGQGTTLTVRGEGMQVVWHALLWSLFVLLALYSLIVLVLIFFKKTGQPVNICRGTWKTGKKNNSTKREDFRAVVQELYGKRKLRSNQKKTNHSGSSQNKVESPHSDHPNDDIYQNL